MSTRAAAYGDPSTRKRILDAAWGLLEERGSGVRIADIADRAGVSRQAVYLHFGDRVSLFVAVADHIDVTFGRDRLREHVFGAATGVESLHRWIETMSWYTARIDPVNSVLERAGDSDEALAAAWRDRMTGRRGHVRRIIDRIAGDGQLATGWTAEAASDLVFAVTLPGPWRALTVALGWSTERYAAEITNMLDSAIVAPTRGES